MLWDLASIDAVEWFRYVFSREPLNGKFNDGQRRDWMEHAMACGREYAVKVMEEYKSTDPEVIAKAMGMKVSYPTYPERRTVCFLPNTGCRIPSASTWML